MKVNLKNYESRHWSQHGEDGVLEKIFEIISPKHKQYIEIGAHFHEANCLKLQQHHKWQGFYFDDFHDFPPLGFHKAWVTKENINELFDSLEQAGIELDLDILSIDIDGNDFYLWNELDKRWNPSLVIVECTTQLDLDDKVIEYDPNFRWDGSVYAGCSATAWNNLAQSRGYSLVYIEQSGVNMFFMRNDLEPEKYFENVGDVKYLLDNTRKECNYPPDIQNRQYKTSIELIK